MPFNIFGFHAIEELLKSSNINGTLLLSRQTKKNEILARRARQAGVKVTSVNEQEIEKICANKKHKGALLILKSLPLKLQSNLKLLLKSTISDKALIVLLDGITDPHNLGAILRSCDQFAVDMVITTTRRAASETQTVVNTSAGASAFVKLITVVNLHNTIDLLKKEDFWIFGTDKKGKSISHIDLKRRVALIMGREGKGLHRLQRDSCDELVCIPCQGHVDSLNVSVATGILLFEIRRQQGFFSAL